MDIESGTASHSSLHSVSNTESDKVLPKASGVLHFMRRALPAVLLAGACGGAAASDPWRTMPDLLLEGARLPLHESASLCHNGQDFPVPLGLDEAIDMALCNSPRVRQAWAAIKSQAAAVGEANAAYLPALSNSISRRNEHTRYPGIAQDASSISRNTMASTLDLRIFDFGHRSARRDGAQHMLQAAIFSHDHTVRKTVAVVVNAYFAARAAQSVLLAKEQAVDVAGRILEAATRRMGINAVHAGGRSQAAAVLAKAVFEKTRAAGELSKSLSSLAATLGMPDLVLPVLPDGAETASGEGAQDLRQVLELVRQSHPAITGARAQRDAARSRVAEIKAESYPALDFSYGEYWNGRPSQAVSQSPLRERAVGVTLSIPIFDGFGWNYRLRGARAQVEQRDADLLDAEQQVTLEVYAAHAEAEAGMRNLDAAAELLKVSEEAMRASERQYRGGGGDIAEILNAQKALADARIEQLRAVSEWRAARLRLMICTGSLGNAGHGRRLDLGDAQK